MEVTIKGIDLYKKVLEKDEIILGKEFVNGDAVLVVETTYCNEKTEKYDVWTLRNKNNILPILDGTTTEINNFMTNEWFVRIPKRSVTWEEVLNSNKKVKIEHEILQHYSFYRLGDYISLNVWLYQLGKDFGTPKLQQILKEAKFYLED